MSLLTDELYLSLALAEALKFEGATAPNPPVGAALVKDGRLLSLGAHEKAGTDHAEVVAIKRTFELHGADALRGATLYVTLEPCNHTGRTPPCTKAILNAGIARVVVGTRDPNSRVTGGGIKVLQQAGIQVLSGVLQNPCDKLIAPFKKWSLTGRPYITHKIAWHTTTHGAFSMIPPAGQKTFTSPASLQRAHEERRRSDAILTGRNTVLADNPLFTVRHLADHPHKKRLLAVMTTHPGQLPLAWVDRQKSLGFEVLEFSDLPQALKVLGEHGTLRLLIEAGPRLSQTVIDQGLWDERLIFIKNPGHTTDFVVEEYHSCSQV